MISKELKLNLHHSNENPSKSSKAEQYLITKIMHPITMSWSVLLWKVGIFSTFKVGITVSMKRSHPIGTNTGLNYRSDYYNTSLTS